MKPVQLIALVSAAWLPTALVACTSVDDADSGTSSQPGILRQAVLIGVVGLPDAPLQGATVAIDDGAGTRIAEVQTDAAGIAEVAVDWSDGPFSVTVDSRLDPPQLWTRLAVDDVTPPYAASFLVPSEEETVRVTGVMPDHDASKALLVIAHGAGSDGSQRMAPHGEFELDLLPDTPFELVAVDFDGTSLGDGTYTQTFTNWRLLAGQVSESTPLDMSTSTVATPSTTSLELLLPPGDDSPLRDESAYAYGFVVDPVQGTTPPCGWPTSWGSTTSADTVGLAYEYVTPAIAPELVRYSYVEADTGRSIVLDWGAPETWPATRQLLPVPAFDEHTLDGASLDSWTVTFDDPGALDGVMAMALLAQTTGDWVWAIHGPPELGTFTLPALPSTADAEAILSATHAVFPHLVEPHDAVYNAAVSVGREAHLF